MGNDDIVIRKFEVKDRQALRKIACETAFMGKPGSVFFEGEEVFADALTIYFTDYEPESCFVAEVEGQVAGYLIGTKNTATLEKISNARIYPWLLLKAFTQGVFFKKKNIGFIYRILLSALKGEFKAPDFSRQYPATLHINMREKFRNLGAGAKLICAYLDYLAKENVRGVHLATFSNAGNNFFNKQGFELLYKAHRSYFRHILHDDICISVYGRKLSA